MQFPAPLVQGVLLRRYKRFLSDIRLEDGHTIVAHCANPGSMAGLAEPGAEVWLSPADNPKRKLQWTWELVRDEETGSLVGINTGRANTIVAEALEAGALGPVMPADTVKREVKYGEGSRIDFLLESTGMEPCFLEIKSVTLRRTVNTPHFGEFPDAVTARGTRHLKELSGVCAAGDRAALLYLVQREDCHEVRLAEDIDPAYAAAARAAKAAGVAFMAFDCVVSRDRIAVRRPLPVAL